jgi:hypothetical protein
LNSEKEINWVDMEIPKPPAQCFAYSQRNWKISQRCPNTSELPGGHGMFVTEAMTKYMGINNGNSMHYKDNPGQSQPRMILSGYEVLPLQNPL